ncbi:MAG: glycine oxidase ThiO [Streptosporangiales bacterium]|nr:glycine oxidase ThiO [Streptosporangiales bacterium]
MQETRSTAGQLVVVGGGAIGLSTAWQAARTGFAVTVVDPQPARGASWVAAGMLAPLAEAWPGDEPVLALGLAALPDWPAFAAELHRVTGVDPQLSRAGTVLVGVDTADAGVLDTLAGYLAEQGHQVETCARTALRRLEPMLGPNVRRGLHLPGDVAVDNRALLTALLQACERSGVRFDRRRAQEVRSGEVVLADGSTVPSELTVLAAGAHSGDLHPALKGAIRPVKGELLRLRARHSSLPPPTRTVRALVEGRPVYLVPRASGELVLGATQYEAGFDQDVTAGGVHDLLRDAEEVLPGIAEFAVVECVAGFRAGSPDNLPLIGWLDTGVLVAAGHHRNGLLTAPLTGAAVLALARGEQPPDPVRAADPARLATPARRGGSR